QVPAMAKVEGDGVHQLALRAQPLEEQDELQLEEDHGVDAGPTVLGVAVLDPGADKGKVEPRIQEAVEMVIRIRLLDGAANCIVEQAQLRWTEHRQASCRPRRPVQSTD